MKRKNFRIKKSDIVRLIEANYYYKPLDWKRKIPNWRRIKSFSSYFNRQTIQKLKSLYIDINGYFPALD